MKNSLMTLLIVKPLIILALVVSLKPSSENSNMKSLTEETQTMRGYFLEDQSGKIIVTHRRVQLLKNKILNSPKQQVKKYKNNFIKMVKSFNLAIEEFERLTEYKSKTWNTSRKKFIALMKNVEDQQVLLNQDLSERQVVSI